MPYLTLNDKKTVIMFLCLESVWFILVLSNRNTLWAMNVSHTLTLKILSSPIKAIGTNKIKFNNTFYLIQYIKHII